ncbi:uncharacterized protein EV420DRAFT_1562031 [Desarmillaria tabescens]|uniref:Uncharacterized protein n=1 Tax=Armillaria tabescens TaxID=1929756 RepID=A0AA39MY94_ARMTA|nr:uncharacterized protein EV420DRAFT_1562031 [Desarmillaria tabescens]KAK0450484.1 hypothetical protein EV420DRAFT_1562031 [Desarmillaria tabescens]
MRGQTEAAFVAAGGEPSSSAAPQKKKRKKDPNPSDLHALSPTAEWPSLLADLHSRTEIQLNSLRDQVQSLAAAATTPHSPVDMGHLPTDIANLQKRVSELSAIVTSRFLQQHSAIAGLTASTASLPSLSETLKRNSNRLTNIETQILSMPRTGPSTDMYRVLESRVAELEKTLLSISTPTTIAKPSSRLTSDISPHTPAPLPTRSVDPSLQVVVSGVRAVGNHYDYVAQLMGCMPALSMTVVSSVEHLISSPGTIVITFRTAQNAKDFMSAARSLPERFRHYRFLWADNPDSPIASASASLSKGSPLTGPFVDDRRG